MSITPGQCKAARELLGWQQSELAYDMGVSQGDISLFEAGRGRLAAGHKMSIRRAMESAGIEFMASGGAPGVRMREPQ
jgi:transcriptional regulator with XRE-family HTH domain